MLGDKYGVTIYFKQDDSVSLSCKTKSVLEETLGNIQSLDWFRTRSNSQEILIQTCNISQIRIVEYMTSEDL